MAKDATERRIHVLPTELLERVRAFQTSAGIPSEVEAVRKLLNEALQAREGVEEILKQLKARWREEKDLRSLNKQILSDHTLVKTVHIYEDELEFSLKNQDAGSIDRKGNLRKGREDDQGYFQLDAWDPEPPKRSAGAAAAKPQASKAAGGWSDLDDDIPF